jgi:hypothetical protein
MMCVVSRFFAGKKAAGVKFQVLPKDEKHPAFFYKKPGNSQINIEAFFTVYCSRNVDSMPFCPMCGTKAEPGQVILRKLWDPPAGTCTTGCFTVCATSIPTPRYSTITAGIFAISATPKRTCLPANTVRIQKI